MKNSMFKISFLGLLIGMASQQVFAQKIEEKDLKVGVEKITKSTDQLKNLEPVSYQYAADKYKYLQLPKGERYGFLASNVEASFPDMVFESSKVYSSGKNSTKVAKFEEVNTESLIPLLVAAIKEQQEQIDTLKKELQALKEK